MLEFVRDIVILVVTISVVVLSIICVIVICIVCCYPCQVYDLRGDSRLRSTQRDIENQLGQDEEENGDIRARDLSQGPPPAYRNVNQYQNVDLEHTEVIRTEEAYRVSTHVEPETTSLPPDYTSQRLSISVAPQEVQAPEGQLPPTYSTAQLELMARRIASEQDAIRELSEENTENTFNMLYYCKFQH
jgi:hypothetical protein